jgi:hypothetical protein
MAVSVRENAAVRAAVRLPTWAWVAGIVLLSALAYYAVGRRIVAPWILTDEFVYSEAAKSFANSGELLIRDQTWQQPGPIYPVLISPAWALFKSMPDAYAAAKAINALLISLTAVPAYLLGRRVLSRPLALAGALLSAAIPSMLYSGTLMTENAFYPLFVGSLVALVLALERPTLPRSFLLLGLFILTFVTRAQAVALLPAIVTAPVLLVLIRRQGWRTLRAYWPIYAVTALVFVPAALVQLARGRPLTGLFGRYSVVGNESYPFAAVLKWFVYHVCELDLFVGVLPFAALILLVLLARRLTERQQAFTAAAVAVSFWLVLVVAAVAQTYTTYVSRVEERNMFYLAPLFLIALLVCIERGLLRPGWFVAAAAAIAAALPIVLPLQWMLNVSIVSDTLALIPWWRLDLHLGSSGLTRLLLALACLGAGALFLLLPRRFQLVLPGLVLVYLVVVTAFSAREWHQNSVGALSTVGRPDPDWIDRAVPSGAQVAFLYTAQEGPTTVWETEFWNRSVGPVYDTGEPTPGALPETRLTVDLRTGALRSGTAAVHAEYGISDTTADLAGTRIGSAGALVLVRLPGELRLKSYVQGLYPFSTWSGRHVTYRRYRCRGGSVTVTMTSDPTLFHSPKSVSVRSENRVLTISVPPARPVSTRLPLVPRKGICRLDFTVPSRLLSLPPGSAQRPFGLHFTFG